MTLYNFQGERLWPLDVPGFWRVYVEDIIWSERMVPIACDARYIDHTLRQITGVLIKFGESVERYYQSSYLKKESIQR